MVDSMMFLLFLCVSLNLSARTADEAMESGDYKDAIGQYQRDLEKAAPAKCAEIQLKLAMAHWRDQEQERAFKAFLLALELTPKQVLDSISPDEEILYREALEIYLTHSGREASAGAQQLSECYAKTLCEHPDYHHLGYLVALADANLGQFEAFFPRFYKGYCADPDHFLAYKTRALLHHRLMERARDPTQREEQREQALRNVQQALARFPNDVTLYQMSMSLALPHEKASLVQSALGKMTRGSLVVPRCDVLFFVKEAAAAEEWALAEQFLAQARQWYPSSRQVDTAAEYLQKRRTEIDKGR